MDTVDVSLVNGGFRYDVQVTRSGPGNYFLVMNGSGVEIEYHQMSDGGILLTFNNSSYTVYMKEEVDKYRVQIGNQTIVFEKENDPTELRSTSYQIFFVNFVFNFIFLDLHQLANLFNI